MLHSRRLKWRTPLRLRGEEIYEIFTRKDRLPVGLALAKVDEAPLHFHKRTHEWYVVLEGNGRMKLGNRRIRLSKGRVVYIKPGTKHKPISTTRKPLQILAITSPPWRPADHHEVGVKAKRFRNT